MCSAPKIRKPNPPPPAPEAPDVALGDLNQTASQRTQRRKGRNALRTSDLAIPTDTGSGLNIPT